MREAQLAFTAGGIIMSSKPAVNELRPSSQASASDQLLVVSAVADLAGGVLLWRLSSIMSAHEKLLLSHTMLQKQAQNMQASCPTPPAAQSWGDSHTVCGVLGVVHERKHVLQQAL